MPHSTHPTLYPLITDHISVVDNNAIRKRVCKACDRCRLKKSKCDGQCPCTRCKTDNAICVYGERKKSADKVYPKGYVEMLEQQQTQIVHGVKKLYDLCLVSGVWPGEPLPLEKGGQPLTHDILQRLNCISVNEHTQMIEPFEENFATIQQTLIDNGAPMAAREDDSPASLSPLGSPIQPDTNDTKPFADQHPLFMNPAGSPESRYFVGHAPFGNAHMENMNEGLLSMPVDNEATVKLDLPFSSLSWNSGFGFQDSGPPPLPPQPAQPGPGEFSFDVPEPPSFGMSGLNYSNSLGMAPYSFTSDLVETTAPLQQQPDPAEQERLRRQAEIHTYGAPEPVFHLADYINCDAPPSSRKS